MFSPFLKEHGRESILPRCEPATIADHQQLLALLERYEGEQSARILAHWLAVQPEGAWVIRGDGGEVAPRSCSSCVLDAAGGVDLGEIPSRVAIWSLSKNERFSEPVAWRRSRVSSSTPNTYQGISPQIGPLPSPCCATASTRAELENRLYRARQSRNVGIGSPTSTGFFLRGNDFQFESRRTERRRLYAGLA